MSPLLIGGPAVADARLLDIDPDKLLAELLRAEMPGPGGTRLPADHMLRLAPDGYWLARQVDGGGDVDDRFADAVSVQLDGLAAGATARSDARRLVRRMLMVLRAAQRRSTTTAYGHIARMRVDTWPEEVRQADQPAEFARYTAACALILRPPTD